ncbi:hypothetical protein K5I29_07385 [Flavobacterium agricola]|uniref:Protein-glutamine gamma-glutamyltransferase-like C-terminal domain-containing protein n=1 Tax=Flavobacterium agricola TaxID=2870839 RepID=A0ABY6LWQ7_9FLAO|nr:DUF4129 domain-containing protein [Flavobacterium agricola]UYW00392.1 hypothetical protein K5I29_07385 [Flavobacterium agricola]
MAKKLNFSINTWVITLLLLLVNNAMVFADSGIHNPVKKTEFAEKYSNLTYDEAPTEKKVANESQQKSSFEYKPYYQYLWIGLLILIVGGIAYLLVSNKFGFFNLRSKVDAEKIENAEKHINELNLDDLLNQARNNGDNQALIRFYFLKVIKTLADHKHINWEPQKTNATYYYEIKQPQLQKDYEYASYLYNYVWYGKFTLNSEQLQQAENHFKSMLNNKQL